MALTSGPLTPAMREAIRSEQQTAGRKFFREAIWSAIFARTVDGHDSDGRYRQYFLRLATAEERRAGQDGINIQISDTLGKQLLDPLQTAVPGVAIIEARGRSLLALWDEAGRTIYRDPNYNITAAADRALIPGAIGGDAVARSRSGEASA